MFQSSVVKVRVEGVKTAFLAAKATVTVSAGFMASFTETLWLEFQLFRLNVTLAGVATVGVLTMRDSKAARSSIIVHACRPVGVTLVCPATPRTR